MDPNPATSPQTYQDPAIPQAPPSPPQPIPVQPAPSQPTTPPGQNSSEQKKGGLLLPIIIVIVLLVLGIGGFIAYGAVTKPIIVKEKAQTAKPLLDDYDKTIDKLIKLFEEDTAFETDTYERAAEKGEGLIKTADTQRAEIEKKIKEMSIPELSNYKNYLSTYLKTSDEILNLNKDYVKFLRGYVQPLKDYEEETLAMSGASNYMYSDTQKYVSVINEAIKKEEAIIKNLEGLVFSNDLQKAHETLTKTFRIETDLLIALVKAVETRDTNKITEAQQKYTADLQQILKDFSRFNDKIKDSMETNKDRLESIKSEIDQEYNTLKSKFTF